MADTHPFDQLRIADPPQVGGKAASLEEMFNGVRPLGINVPDGFAITEDARSALSRLRSEVKTGIRRDLHMRFGEPRSSVLAEATPRDADLVVLGAHGRKGLVRAFVGSVVEGVLRGAAGDVPVTRLPKVPR